MDTSEGQARNFLCGILKVLWNRGWGRPGYEWLRMNDVGVDDCILSAADLLDTTEERLWTFLRPFARKSDFAISKRYSASESQTFRVNRKRTSWWAPTFNSATEPRVLPTENYNKLKGNSSWKPRRRRAHVETLSADEKHALLVGGYGHLLYDNTSSSSAVDGLLCTDSPRGGSPAVAPAQVKTKKRKRMVDSLQTASMLRKEFVEHVLACMKEKQSELVARSAIERSTEVQEAMDEINDYCERIIVDLTCLLHRNKICSCSKEPCECTNHWSWGLPEGNVPFDANKTTCSIMNSSLDYKAILAKGEKTRVEAKASRRKLKVKQGQWVGERYRNADGTLKEAFILFCGQVQDFCSAEWTEKETFTQVYSRKKKEKP
jgi:hypothetical protein